MTAQIEQLVEQAGRLASSGRWDEAEQVWLEVRRREPQHPRALFSLGVHALKRGDGASAHELLTAAHKLVPGDLLVLPPNKKTPVRIARDAADPDLLVTPSGEPLIAWERVEGGTSSVFVARIAAD